MNLRFFRDVPIALRISAYIYLTHILMQWKLSLSEITAFFAILFLGWAVARREVVPSFHILYYPLLLYGIVSTTSAIVNDATQHTLFDAMTWFKMMIFPAALIIYRAVPHVREVAVRCMTIFAAGIALSGIYQYFVLGQRSLEQRITGPAPHVMTFSGQLLPVALLLIVLAAHRRQAWLWASAGVVSLALFLTLTRSYWFGWLAGVLVLLILKRPRWLLFAIPVLLITITFLPMNFFGRLVSSFDIRQESNLDRIRMAQAGQEMIKDYPALGVGPAAVKEIYPLYRKEDAPRFRPPHLHNNVIQLWAERGILGLAAYLLLIALFLRECARGWNGPRREFAQAGVAITVGLAYAGLFEFNFGDTEVFYLMLELYALVVASLESADEAVTNELRPKLVPQPSTAPA